MRDFPKKLIKKLENRVEENSLRTLPSNYNLVDFSSNDYLGFSKETWIGQRAQEILKTTNLKNGATGSRLLSGNHQLFEILEKKLCNFHGSKAALVFNSGYDANLGFFGSIPQRGDLIFYDELSHASIRDGIQLSRSKSFKFKHNDLADLRTKLELSGRAESRAKNAEIYIVTESVFSMDGGTPDLKSLAKFCKENTYHLIVDEAHATGIFGEGKGLCEETEITTEVFARIITFGKAIGCHGAAILGSTQLKSFLVNFARSFIYTTALPPHTIASILAAYDFLDSPKGLLSRQYLLDNSDYFKQELKAQNLYHHFIESESAILCIEIGGNTKVKIFSEKLKEEGFNVKAILSPTVPKGKERLRFCLHSFNTKEEIKKVVQILKEI